MKQRTTYHASGKHRTHQAPPISHHHLPATEPATKTVTISKESLQAIISKAMSDSNFDFKSANERMQELQKRLEGFSGYRQVDDRMKRRIFQEAWADGQSSDKTLHIAIDWKGAEKLSIPSESYGNFVGAVEKLCNEAKNGDVQVEAISGKEPAITATIGKIETRALL